MGAVPCFDFGAAMDPRTIAHVEKAAREIGCFYVRHPLFRAARCEQALADARAFFSVSQAAKERLSIERSPHFRGYSEMRNERDWREQIHFGREEPAGGPAPAYQRLRGPNLWPDDPAWRDRTIALMRDFETAGRAVLNVLAEIVGRGPLLAIAEKPYWLLKMIRYLAAPGNDPRSGVAPHVDFSWITLLLQDADGLEIRTPAGEWLAVPPRPGTLTVNLGEVLEFATAGQYEATPHRVIREPDAESRISMPFFLNPSLDRTVHRVGEVRKPPSCGETYNEEHVHRVLQGEVTEPMQFGQAEWRRKGKGYWCELCIAAARAPFQN
jgi:isopenicillin N synthase-like dioxygenase